MRGAKSLVLAMLLLACATAHAQAAAPSLGIPVAGSWVAGPREAALLADLADGSLDAFSLFEAALLAQGAEQGGEEKLAEALLEQHAQRVATVFPAGASQREQAEAVYAYLHGQILLGSYGSEESELAAALRVGEYNCLSATILFMALCERVGLPIEPLARPGHVLCRVAGTEPTLIETTCPEWFSLDETERGNAATAAVGSRRVAGSAGGGFNRPLSREELLGKVYYNRGLAEMEAERFDSAVELFALAEKLDAADAAARENQLAALNNGALALAAAGNWEAAAERIVAGRRIDAAYAPLASNDLLIHRQWLLQLVESGQRTKAATVLAELARRQRRPDLANEWARELGIDLWQPREPAHGSGI